MFEYTSAADDLEPVDKVDDWFLTAPLSELNKTHIELVQLIIKKNKSLLHLNLDSTNLSETLIMLVGKAMRRAKTLSGIHLSDNPGTSAFVTKNLKSLIRARDSDQHISSGFSIKSIA